MMPGPLVGQRLGPYEIRSLLGAGGMGEVYRARDTQLGRDVAIKILPAAFTADADRRARFEREARLLAALNHPHIGGIYGLEHHEDIHGLVLELVEGETLAESLSGGALPVREALAIARQVADALEAAHEKGIVHRDLKPANIVITREGMVKVLDFGLAKAGGGGSAPDVTHSPTVTLGGTQEGVILGTASYMSPEQARGKVVDKRTDIWAFGCVLYQMLTGRVAFAGETVSDTLVAILEREPAWGELPPATPANVRRLLQRCLEKDPKRRLHDIADARIEIDDALAAPTTMLAAEARPPARRRSIVLGTLLGLLAGALIGGFALRFARPPTPGGVARFTIALPTHVELGESIALSPDGRTLVYSGRDDSGSRLYKRSLDTLESVPIRGTEGASYPFFSPDGTSVGFSVERALKRVSLQGGAAITVSETGGGDVGAWLSDDTIVFSSEFRGLKRVPASGGKERPVTTLDGKRGEVRHLTPVVLPGERAVLLTVHLGGRDSQRVDVASLASEERTALIQGNGARFLPTGHILFQRQESLWVAPFDQTRLALTGEPTAVVEGVGIGPDWGPIVAVGRNGSLAYAMGGAEPYPPRDLIWVDREGREEPIDAPARAWWWPQVSPDGRRLGFHIMDPVNMDAWIYELDHGPLVRMTYDPLQDGYPLWTPDGKHVVFWSRQAGGPANLFLRSADLAGKDVRLTTSPNGQVPFSWARGGELLVFQEESPDTGMDIGVVPIQGNRVPQLLVRGRYEEGHPAMSSDGRWIAYQSDLSGQWEVYVQPFPSLAGRWQVSTHGGLSPIWHPSGRELFFRSGRAVMSVPVETTGTSFRYGNPKVLFEGSYVAEGVESWSARSYALSPDGQRFLMMKEGGRQDGSAGATQIVVIANWVEELKRLVPTKRARG